MPSTQGEILQQLQWRRSATGAVARRRAAEAHARLAHRSAGQEAVGRRPKSDGSRAQTTKAECQHLRPRGSRGCRPSAALPALAIEAVSSSAAAEAGGCAREPLHTARPLRTNRTCPLQLARMASTSPAPAVKPLTTSPETSRELRRVALPAHDCMDPASRLGVPPRRAGAAAPAAQPKVLVGLGEPHGPLRPEALSATCRAIGGLRHLPLSRAPLRVPPLNSRSAQQQPAR